MGKVSRQERVERQLKAAVEQISGVMIRFFEATSGERGVDCANHATLGRALLRDFEFEAMLVVGYAAWTIGTDKNAIICHVPHERGYALPGTQGFIYHAWLQCAGRIIDFTTYQLVRKARLLDAMAGGYTKVTWSPPFLMIAPYRTLTYEQVQRSKLAGVAYYEPRPELVTRFEGTDTLALDHEDLLYARLLLADPSLGIAGPNRIIDHPGPVSEKLQMLEQWMDCVGSQNVPATVKRVAQHLRSRSVPLTNDEVGHLERLLARVPPDANSQRNAQPLMTMRDTDAARAP